MIEKIVPVILVFVSGYFLKKRQILTLKDAELLLKLFFYVSLPSLIIVSVAQMNLTVELLWLPVIAALVMILSYGVAAAVGRMFSLDNSSFGVFLIGSLVMNNGFVFPFIIAVKGAEGLAKASLFDFGSSMLVFTFVYYLACKYGKNSYDAMAMMKKFISSPPLLALIAGLSLCLARLELPTIAVQFFKIFGNMASPLMMLSLGIYFNPKVLKAGPLLAAILLRMAGGLLLGMALVRFFDLHGLSKVVVLVCAAAPAGVSTLVFSSLEELDNEFAASIVSYSTLAGLVLIPLLLRFIAD